MLQEGLTCEPPSSESGFVPPLLCGLQNGLEQGDWVIANVKERHQWPFLCILSHLVQRNCHEKIEEGSHDIELMTRLLRKKAPNLTINTPNALADFMYIWISVAVGIMIQGLVFFFNAYIAYDKKWLRAGAQLATYGFPLWASGTLSIIIGLSICGHAIENVTSRRPDTECRVVRFQKAVPSMNLPAYAFLHRDSQVLVSQRTLLFGKTSITDSGEKWQDITTDLSLRGKDRMAFTTLLGTGFSLAGFILQNLGTRELHFSASVAQPIAKTPTWTKWLHPSKPRGVLVTKLKS